MPRLWLQLGGLVLAMAMSSCGSGTPDQRYVCTCQATCGDTHTSHGVVLCEADSSGVASDSVATCVRETACPGATCTCTCNASGNC